MLGYLGGALFTLTVSALANTIDYEPLFALLFLFDVVAAIVLWAFVGVRGPSAATRRVTRRWNLPAGMRVDTGVRDAIQQMETLHERSEGEGACRGRSSLSDALSLGDFERTEDDNEREKRRYFRDLHR